MPNRIIKESIWTSPNMRKLSSDGERHFYRCLMTTDDFGCFEATPLVIRGKCYPLYPEIKEKDILAWNHELELAGIARFWTDGERNYGIFINFSKHQRIRATHLRKTPEPPADIFRPLTTPDSECPPIFNPNHNFNKEKTLCDSDESHRGESSNAQNEITPPKRSPLRAWFEDVMWPAVPTIKKRGKEPTWAQVQKLKPDESTRAAIVTYFTSYYQIKRTYDQAQAKDKPHFPDMADPIRVIRDKRFLDALIPYKDPHAVVRPKRIYIIREDYEKAIARGENAEYRPPQGDSHV